MTQRFSLLITLLMLGSIAAFAQSGLEAGFKNPSPQYRPDVFYQVMGGVQTREGITQDFEAMAREGVGGVLLMQMPDQLGGVVQWPFREYPGKIKVLSEEWFANWNFAIGEAYRLGLTFSMVSCPGWSHMGGPWVKPENGLKILVGEKTNMKGPSNFDGVLPRKAVSYEPKPTLPEWASDRYAWHKLKESYGDYYRDVAVIAYSADGNEPNKSIAREKILDLTDKMDRLGRLKWTVPEGNWTVVRIGYAGYNGCNYPAPIEATGLECDRMDANAVLPVLDNYVGRLAREARAKGYKSFKGFDTDSYESGMQDYCADFGVQFKKRMGYECRDWLLAWLDKTIVIGSEDLTNRFRLDMGQVISDLWMERFYAGIRRWADTNHIVWMIEPYFKLTNDWRTIASKADIAGSEFWVTTGLAPEDAIVADLFGPAPDTSALYGKNEVWAEAFTANSYCSAYRNDPWRLKPFGDNAFCHGVNHFVMHGFVHNPFGDKIKPGYSFGLWGTQLSRNITWWPYSLEWHRYIARCQFMLSQGVPVADVLAYPPRVEPVPSPVLDCAPYKQVVCNDETLLRRLSVKDGRIMLPNGNSYAALAIPPNGLHVQRGTTPEALERICSLVKDGATLIGEPVPDKSVSMKDYPKCDERMTQLIMELWGPDKQTKQGQRKVGKGCVIWGRPIRKVLDEITGGPDFELVGEEQLIDKAKPWDLRWNYFHRRTQDAEIYFIANLKDEPIEAEARFHVAGRKPELWDAVSEHLRLLPQYQREGAATIVPMKLEPRQSYFVVFRKESDAPTTSKVNFPDVKTVMRIEGRWEVAFDPNWGGPAKIEFSSLEDWTKRPEKGIKYYSGTATYSKTFDVPKSGIKTNMKVYLDLGKVKNLARVRLNGKDMGVVWCAPWRTEIGSVLKAKNNKLEIEVVNTWVSRIIGDEQESDDCEFVKVEDKRKGGFIPGMYGAGLKDLPDWLVKGEPRASRGRYTFVNWQFYDKNSPLLESGLMGPVRIIALE